MKFSCITWIRQGYEGGFKLELNLQLGQLITFFMMSIALGMDAFSLGIGIGLQKLSGSQIMKISTTIGMFHVIMPLIGIMTGYYLLTFIGNIAKIIGGGLLVLLGINMLYSSFFGEKEKKFDYTSGFGLILLAISVSIDALSVGFSLGLFLANLWLVIIMFGFMGALMTALGLSLGNKLGSLIGDYGEAFGGIILLVFGIKFLV